VHRILIVEDERDIRTCVTDLLSLIADCHVESAGTFREGSARAREPWDLVISDFFLPDGNGVELLAACAEANPEVPRVLMSAFDAHPKVVAAMDGATLTAFIQKPFDPEAVLERVQALLQRP
jgi:DNA-binding NtrC family response regulator